MPLERKTEMAELDIWFSGGAFVAASIKDVTRLFEDGKLIEGAETVHRRSFDNPEELTAILGEQAATFIAAAESSRARCAELEAQNATLAAELEAERKARAEGEARVASAALALKTIFEG